MNKIGGVGVTPVDENIPPVVLKNYGIKDIDGYIYGNEFARSDLRFGW